MLRRLELSAAVSWVQYAGVSEVSGGDTAKVSGKDGEEQAESTAKGSGSKSGLRV
jgi:hypothetical protein